MLLKKFASCLLAASLAAAAASAQADVTFETRLSNVAFSVTDLAPDDGVVAAYDYSLTSNVYRLGLYGPGEVRKEVSDNYSGLTPVSHAIDTGESWVSGSHQGVPGEYGLAGAVQDNLEVGGGGSAWMEQNYTFTLTANSALNLSAHLLMQISPSSNPYQGGSALTMFTLASPDIDSLINEFKYFDLRYNNGGLIDDDYVFSYANTTNQDITVNVQFWSSSSSFISAVPEPSTYAMLGLGLLTVAAASRRRRKIAS